MAQIVKKGKLFVDIFYKPELTKSFELHRDLKSCITLAEAQEILSERQEEYLTLGKTAILQFLNGYPLNHNLKKGYLVNLNLGPFQILKKLKGLSAYEQQLKYGIYSKLRQYLNEQSQIKVKTLVQQQQKAILQQIKLKPYDMVHAFNFLFLQKEGTKSDIFYHCIDIVKQTDYQILQTSLANITPMLLRRLHLFDWAYFRRFKHLSDFIVYDYKPLNQGSLKSRLVNLIPIAQLELHRVGYQKIPKCIDDLIGGVCQQLQAENKVDILMIQTTLMAFKYLPIGYNEKDFILLYAKLLQKLNKSSEYFHADKLPYNRLKFNQIQQLFDKGFRNNDLLQNIAYIGNDIDVRKWLRKTGLVNRLLSEYLNMKDMKVINQKHYGINVTTCNILIQEFHNNTEVLNEISKKYQMIMDHIERANICLNIFRSLSLCSIFQIEQNRQKLNLTSSRRKYFYYFEQFAKRQKQFGNIEFIDNVNQAILMFHNTSNKIIIQWINIIITKLMIANFKFNFKFFSHFIFLLETATLTDHFHSAKEIIYTRLKSEDCFYFVELYLRFGDKSIKGNTSIMAKMWEKQKSFQSIGKFLTINNYDLFSSSRGELQITVKKILQSSQPSLCLEDVQCFMLYEIISIMKFLNNFLNFLPSFSSKFLNLSLAVVQKLSFERTDPKTLLAFLEQSILLNKQSLSNQQNGQRIMKIFWNIKKHFKQTSLLRAKQLQFRWILGEAENSDRVGLAVEEILEEISNSNNSIKALDTALILLKLSAFQAITLSKKMSQQLIKLSLSALQKDEKQVKQVMSITRFIVKKSNDFINPKKAEGLLQLIIFALQRLKTRHSFEYYIHLIQLAKECSDQRLLKMCFDHLSSLDVKLYPPQIKKLLKIFNLYPFIQVNGFREKLVKEVHNQSDYMQEQLTEVLYTLHSLRDAVPSDQNEIYNSLFANSQGLLLEQISKQNTRNNEANASTKSSQMLISVLKSLWISIKTKKFDKSSITLFQYVRKKQNDLLQTAQLWGLNWEYIYYIHYVFEIKYKEVQAKQGQKKQETQKKALFNFKSKNKPNKQLIQIQKKVQIFKKLFKAYDYTLCPKVKQALQKIGLQNTTQDQAVQKTNVYVCNYKIRGTALPLYIKKQGKQYGLLVLQQSSNFFNEKNEKRGKVDFLVSALQVITKLPTQAVTPGDKIQLY